MKIPEYKKFTEIPMAEALPGFAREELARTHAGLSAIKVIEALVHQHNLVVSVANAGIDVSNEANGNVKRIEAQRMNPFSWLPWYQ